MRRYKPLDYDNKTQAHVNAAYAAGRAAGQLGRAKNPYRKGTQEYRAWQNGYAVSLDQRMRR